MESHRQTDGRRVLVVEDEALIAMLVETMLKDLGCEVVGPAHSLATALDLVAGEARIDAALIDLNLGGQSAFPIADALRARGVPIIFCTGYGDAGLREADRGSLVLAKPYRAPDVFAKLNSVLGGSQAISPPPVP